MYVQIRIHAYTYTYSTDVYSIYTVGTHIHTYIHNLFVYNSTYLSEIAKLNIDI